MERSCHRFLELRLNNANVLETYEKPTAPPVFKVRTATGTWSSARQRFLCYGGKVWLATAYEVLARCAKLEVT